MDEEDIQRQQEIYKVAGVDENEPAMESAKKRKAQGGHGDDVRQSLCALRALVANALTDERKSEEGQGRASTTASKHCNLCDLLAARRGI